MLRRRRPPADPPTAVDPLADLDLAALPRRLEPVVQQAIDAYRRWEQVVAAVAAGPLADRLTSLGEQVRAGVQEVYATAARVGEVERVLAALDPDGATEAFKAAKRRAAEGRPPAEMEAVEARFTSVQRMLNLVADADEQLRVLDARLLAAVARAAEVALTTDAIGLGTVSSDLDGVVSELGALRGALSSLG